MDDRRTPTRDRRWARLIRFAAVNLVIWILVAIVAGFLASQRINLGFEAFFRQGPATMVAMVREAVLPPSAAEHTPAATRVQEAEAPSVTATPGSIIVPSVPAADTRTSEPVAGKTTDLPPTFVAPEPMATPVAYILSWADPPVDRVLQIDAEMERSAVGRDVYLRYTEAGLNAEVATFLQRFPFLPYSDVTLDLQPGRVTVRGRVNVLGITAEVEASGPVFVRDCRLWAEIETLAVMGMPTPGLIEHEINLLLQEALAWYPDDFPLCLEAIWMDDHGVSLDGYRR